MVSEFDWSMAATESDLIECRRRVLREVREAIDATYESSVSLPDFREKSVKRLDRILALFRAGGRFAVEGEEGE